MNEKSDTLVRLLDYDDDFIIDLRYATADNFTGCVIYSSNECWVHRHTAEILIRAKNIFKNKGYKVKVLDAYRPVSAQRKFWEVMPYTDYVAPPPELSTVKSFRPRHMNGMCVDITLTDMDGKEILMPSVFDDMSERASLDWPGHLPEAVKNGRFLKEVMESVGFEGYENEWWHFYDVSCEPAPYSDFRI